MVSEFYNKEQLMTEKKGIKMLRAAVNGAGVYTGEREKVEAILGRVSGMGNSALIAVTDEDVIYYSSMPFVQKRFSLSSITGVDVSNSTWAIIELMIGGAKIESLETYSLLYEANLMRDLILSKLNNQTAKNNEISASDEISKFFDLKEKGIITEEEFQAKKKQLLNL